MYFDAKIKPRIFGALDLADKDKLQKLNHYIVHMAVISWLFWKQNQVIIMINDEKNKQIFKLWPTEEMLKSFMYICISIEIMREELERDQNKVNGQEF